MNPVMEPNCESARHASDMIVEATLKNEITFHLIALNICCGFACIAVALSLWQILRHALHYLRPYEQKHIIRILAMIPIYAFSSFLSFVFYPNAIYYELVRDCYEAYAIASFFTLMCHYVAPSLHEQKVYLRNVRPKNWNWPLNWIQKLSGGVDKGWLRRPRSGLTWFNIVYVGIFQYCLIRPLFTIVAVIAQSQDSYCQSSKHPLFASVWVAGFDAISVAVAMFCLVQFYVQVKEDLAPHRPLLKLTSIKLVIFLCFWQNWLIAFLTAESGPLKPGAYVAGPDLRIGIPCLLTCVEMAIFAVLHRWAFPWRPYDIDRLPRYPKQYYASGPNEALIEAMYPWDYAKAGARGFRWLFHGVRFRKEDSSYHNETKPVVEAVSAVKARVTARTDPTHNGDQRRGAEGRKTV